MSIAFYKKGIYTVLIFIVSCINIDYEYYYPAEKIPSFLETEPVVNGGDAADDCAIWINDADITLSRIIATDKKGGLVVYDLSGKITAYINDGLLNNVDLRYDFNLGGSSVCIIAASNRSNNTISIYKMNEVLLIPEDISNRDIFTDFSDAYGICMYKSSISGLLYVFVTDHSGQIEQWRLFDAGNGRIDAEFERTVKVNSTAEGCVAFDEKNLLFVAEEHGGIWMFDAEPTGSMIGEKVINISSKNYYLTPEIEGLTIIRLPGDRNYLVASVQGNDSFAIFHIQDGLTWKGSFRLSANKAKGIDRVTHTDGIDAYSGILGHEYPEGIFIAQDDDNTPSGLNQNFKFLPLEKIIAKFGL